MDAGQQAEAIDPEGFFDALVERYRRLEIYEDAVSATFETSREGEPVRRVETRLSCRVAEGRLDVQTPGSQVRSGLGLEMPVPRSPAMEALVRRYQLWLAPHMALRFTEDPSLEFRAGVEEGFQPVAAEPVERDGRPMIRLVLESGDGLTDQPQAQFVLSVNASSMLVERIEGQQRLPDGALYRTELDIEPVRAEDQPAPPADDAV